MCFPVCQSKASKTRTPPSRTSKSTPKAQKISPSKGNSRSPHTPSPSKTSLAQGHGARTRDTGTPPGRGSSHTVRRELGLSSSSSSSSSLTPGPSSSSAGEGASLLWVDKYRPRSLKTVIGQQGEQSCANKLLRWLQHWHTRNSGGAGKPTGNRTLSMFQRILTFKLSGFPSMTFFVALSAVQLRGLVNLEGKMMDQDLKLLCSLDHRGWGRLRQQP